MLTGCTLFLIIAAIGTGWRQIALEVDVDKNYIRCAFIFAAPFQIWLALVRRPTKSFVWTNSKGSVTSSSCNQLQAVSLS